MNNSDTFVGVSVLCVDLLQLPPMSETSISQKLPMTHIARMESHLWRMFQLHELRTIMRQANDPEFAEILARARKGTHTVNDVLKLTNLEHKFSINTKSSCYHGDLKGISFFALCHKRGGLSGYVYS